MGSPQAGIKEVNFPQIGTQSAFVWVKLHKKMRSPGLTGKKES